MPIHSDAAHAWQGPAAPLRSNTPFQSWQEGHVAGIRYDRTPSEILRACSDAAVATGRACSLRRALAYSGTYASSPASSSGLVNGDRCGGGGAPGAFASLLSTNSRDRMCACLYPITLARRSWARTRPTQNVGCCVIVAWHTRVESTTS